MRAALVVSGQGKVGVAMEDVTVVGHGAAANANASGVPMRSDDASAEEVASEQGTPGSYTASLVEVGDETHDDTASSIVRVDGGTGSVSELDVTGTSTAPRPGAPPAA